ncbi:protein FAM214A-like [Octopus sinensis]|uniref:Protein FAM214A-like n=1 Tax=Octopus sinensis TaxID=2607531 RepID=A0A6P7TUV4_9MOLL|nr:protein FAM214A-like [Octopus sinensis]
MKIMTKKHFLLKDGRLIKSQISNYSNIAEDKTLRRSRSTESVESPASKRKSRDRSNSESSVSPFEESNEIQDEKQESEQIRKSDDIKKGMHYVLAELLDFTSQSEKLPTLIEISRDTNYPTEEFSSISGNIQLCDKAHSESEKTPTHQKMEIDEPRLKTSIFVPKSPFVITCRNAPSEPENVFLSHLQRLRANANFQNIAPSTNLTRSLLNVDRNKPNTYLDDLLVGEIRPVGYVADYTIDFYSYRKSYHKKETFSLLSFYFDNSLNTPELCPYLGFIDLQNVEYRIPSKGKLQLILFQPNKKVKKIFLIEYNLTSMPPNETTYIRQKLIYAPIPVEGVDMSQHLGYLQYCLHLKCGQILVEELLKCEVKTYHDLYELVASALFDDESYVLAERVLDVVTEHSNTVYFIIND